MNSFEFNAKIRIKIAESIPLPFSGQTSARLLKLFEVGREDLSLAKICEAHWDAQSILAEAHKTFDPQLLYGVWASEIPGNQLKLTKQGKNYFLNGTKMFCSGAGIIDRALVTAFSKHSVMIDLDLKSNKDHIKIKKDLWYTNAFKHTNTASVTFDNFPVKSSAIIDDANWYVIRPGFWVGALGPAACWAGGATGLMDYAQQNKRHDAHTLAHLGAMSANVWMLKAIITSAGDAIDNDELSAVKLHELALTSRYQIEQLSTDMLRRFARAYGPYPLACVETISQRYQELDLFLRQNHAERDLECLGMLVVNDGGA